MQQASAYPAAVKQWSPVVAVILSIVWPGLGHIYRGKVLRGIIWMIVVLAGYYLIIIPGAALHIICIFMSAIGDPYKR